MAQSIEVPAMTREEGIWLLLHRGRRMNLQSEPTDSSLALSATEYAEARTLTEILGGLPLALNQAGAYIEETQCSLSDFRQLFQAHPLCLLGECDIHADYPRCVIHTFMRSIEQVRQSNPVAVELLIALSFLGPDPIPERLLIDSAAYLGPQLTPLVVDPLQFNAMLKSLLTSSLIRRNPQDKTITVHSLLQTVLRQTLSEEHRIEWGDRVLQVLDAALPTAATDPFDLNHAFSPSPIGYIDNGWCERILPHALSCLEFVQANRTIHPALVSLQQKIAATRRTRIICIA